MSVRCRYLPVAQSRTHDLPLPEPTADPCALPIRALLARSDFFPVIVTFLRQLPVIGTVLTLPGIRQVGRLYRYIA